MEIAAARKLIRPAILPGIQMWADLGAGGGLFTRALAEELEEGSSIWAVDRQATPLTSITVKAGIHLTTRAIDFTSGDLDLAQMDGILMANSLHFVNDKLSLLRRLSTQLRNPGRLLLVEYDTNRSNQWVPFPISLRKLEELVFENGLGTVTKVGEAESIYNSSGMYSAVVEIH